MYLSQACVVVHAAAPPPPPAPHTLGVAWTSREARGHITDTAWAEGCLPVEVLFIAFKVRTEEKRGDLGEMGFQGDGSVRRPAMLDNVQASFMSA